jgi:hypothetical protein
VARTTADVHGRRRTATRTATRGDPPRSPPHNFEQLLVRDCQLRIVEPRGQMRRSLHRRLRPSAHIRCVSLSPTDWCRSEHIAGSRPRSCARITAFRFPATAALNPVTCGSVSPGSAEVLPPWGGTRRSRSSSIGVLAHPPGGRQPGSRRECREDGAVLVRTAPRWT